MSLTNPAGAGPAQADAYIHALLDLLGERDPFAVQEELPGAVGRLIDGVPEEALRRPERTGKWSMLQVLGHLVDTEVINAWRVRRIVAEDRPPIEAYDQDRWAAVLPYGDDPWREALDELAALRRRNLRLYRSLGPAALDRVGLHAERGEESARRLLRMTAGHDLAHRRQLARIRRAVLGG
ncbi:MAG TPA: DinB family protein [Gemmatimonadales bacterium]|nr:DinB family protein [Gemmatimonadales bacterium]